LPAYSESHTREPRKYPLPPLPLFHEPSSSLFTIWMFLASSVTPLRDKWITIEWTFTPGSKGKAACVIRNGSGAGAPVAAQGSMSNVNIPDEGDYVRPKWGIYRSVQSASSDILDTYLNFRNYTAGRA
jgi:hypothetical protein